MSQLIDYKGLKLPWPESQDIGGAAISENFRFLADFGGGGKASATFYVDGNRSEENANGSINNPFSSIQQAIDAALKTQTSRVAIQIAPGHYPEPTVIDLPDSPLHLAIHGTGIGPANVTVAGPIHFQLASATSRSQMISIQDICFTANGTDSDTAFKISDSAQVHYVNFFLNNVQCYAANTAEYAFHLTDAGGGGLLQVQCDGHCLFKTAVEASDASQKVTGLRLDRGKMTSMASGFYGLRAPAVLLNGDAFFDAQSSYVEVYQGGQTEIDVDAMIAADSAILKTYHALVLPGKNGQVITHNGVFTGEAGYVLAVNLGAQRFGEGTGGLNLPNGAALLGAQMTDEQAQPLPVSIANPALRLYMERDVNIGFTAQEPAHWAAPAPVNISDAINRLAAEIANLKGSPVA